MIVDPDGWNGRLRAVPIVIPGDLSSATFLFVAAATVAGSDVTVENVGLNPTRAGALDVLAAMGADIEITADGRRDGRAGRRGARARVAAARHACRAASWRCERSTRFRRWPSPPRWPRATRCSPIWPSCGSRSRIASSPSRASCAGPASPSKSAPTGSSSTGLGGRPPAGGTVQPEHDHRIAMAGAVMGLSAGDETVVPAADIATSFPGFADTLAALGARI